MHCKTCNTGKAPGEFYASNQSSCKDCIKARVTANRQANLERVRAYDRMRGSMPHRVAARQQYQRTPAFAEIHQAAVKRWQAKHPERKRASTAVNKAIRSGKLIPWPVCAVPTCSCKPEAHHPDYSRPLDVVWLCDEHHKQAHNIAREATREVAFS